MNERPWQRFAFWLPLALGLAVAIAWASLQVEPYFALWLVFPALAGTALGAVLASLAHLCRLADLKLLAAGTLASVLLCVAMQHWIAYRQVVALLRQREAALLAKAPMAGALTLAGEQPPTSVWQFLRDDAAAGRVLFGGWRAQGAACWLSWGLDAMLVLAAALAMVILWRPRLPGPTVPTQGASDP
jgi:hypothetical protein